MTVSSAARRGAIKLLDTLGFGGSEVEGLVAGVELTGSEEPWFPSPLLVSELATSLHVALSVLANIVSVKRMGMYQAASVDMEHATAWLTAHMQAIYNDMDYEDFAKTQPPSNVKVLSASETTTANFRKVFQNTFTCGDGRQIQFFMNVTDTPERVLKTIGIPPSSIPHILSLVSPAATPATLTEAYNLIRDKCTEWRALEMEERMRVDRVAAPIVHRTSEEFGESEQGKVISRLPTIQVIHHTSPPSSSCAPAQASSSTSWGPSPFTKFSPTSGKGLLSGVKVIELTRALMGPRQGTLLAALGANVIRVTAPSLDEFFDWQPDVNAGKRMVHLNLKDPSDKQKLVELIADADIVMQNNAYGAMERMGTAWQDVFRMVRARNRGIIYVQGNCYGYEGPLMASLGYEHLAQGYSGCAMEHGRLAKTEPPTDGNPGSFLIPVNILDTCTGLAGCLGALTALIRRSEEGGSYLVQVSLLSTAIFLRSLGRHPDDVVVRNWKNFEGHPKDVEFDKPGSRYLVNFQTWYLKRGRPSAYAPRFWLHWRGTKFGAKVSILAPPVRLSLTPLRYRISPMPFGADPDPRWKADDAMDCRVSESPNSFEVVLVTAGLPSRL